MRHIFVYNHYGYALLYCLIFFWGVGCEDVNTSQDEHSQDEHSQDEHSQDDMSLALQDQLIDHILDDADLFFDLSVHNSSIDQDINSMLSTCSLGTQQTYDPFNSTELQLFPDPLLTITAPQSPTGQHLHLDAELYPWIHQLPDILTFIKRDLNTLSGFACNAAVLFRFNQALNSDFIPSVDDSIHHPHLLFIDLDAQPPQRLHYRAVLKEEGRALFVYPVEPLKMNHQYTVIIKSTHLALDGGCIEPSPTLKMILSPDHPSESDFSPPQLSALSSVRPQYEQALEQLSLNPQEISAMTVFKTHQDSDIILQVAENVRTQEYRWDPADGCQDRHDYRVCERSFEAYDYRTGRSIQSPSPQSSWNLKVSIYLPNDQESSPYPVILYAHGMSTNRHEADLPALYFTSLGFAVVAVDALKHGEHPTVDPQSIDLDRVFSFLGIDLREFKIDGLSLKGHFDQTNIDRLQLIELLKQDSDFDEDGRDDLNVDQLFYLGVSLGGILGSELISVAPDIQTSMFLMGGARLLTLATETSQTDRIKPLLINLFGSQDRFDRLGILAQTQVDASDPANFAFNYLRPRLSADSEHPLNLLLSVAIYDEVLPLAATENLAHALGLTHMEPISLEVPLLSSALSPLSGNIGSGEYTAGYFQFDRVMVGDEVQYAGHQNLPLSQELKYQLLEFFQSAKDDTSPQIINPYEVSQTPELSEMSSP